MNQNERERQTTLFIDMKILANVPDIMVHIIHVIEICMKEENI